ncbi:uncharacterized protein ACN63O_017288 [Diretmus argenteus]
MGYAGYGVRGVLGMRGMGYAGYGVCGVLGRDDHPADCIVYFGFADIFRISTMVVMENVGQKKLLQMVDYCQNVDRCRRSLMAVHFDEVWDDEGCNQMCDTCRHGKDCVTVDISQHAREVVQILELAASLDEKLTPLKVVEAWMGKGPAKRRKMIQTTTLPRLEVEAIIVRLLQQGYLGEDFSFTPYTTYFYLKLGRKAPLLKNQTHTLNMKMKKTGVESATNDAPAVEANEEEVDMTFDPSPLPPKLKRIKEQKNLARKQDSKPIGRTERAKKRQMDKPMESHGEEEEEEHMEEEKRRPVEVDVEINIIANVAVNDGEKTPPRPVKPNPKQKSTTPQRPRRKPHADVAAADIPTPPPGGAAANTDRQRPVLVNSPSQASFISETAAEELCDLRNYYSKQLRRINYISHEYLGQQSEPGVLACIREPLRNLRLPRGVTIARTARSLWTRVSGRRKLVHR